MVTISARIVWRVHEDRWISAKCAPRRTMPDKSHSSGWRRFWLAASLVDSERPCRPSPAGRLTCVR